MTKLEALQTIKEYWNNPQYSLADKIRVISNAFYDVGLDLALTAAYVNATPAELDALLSLGGLDDSLINLVSEVNPPKTIWELLANASDDEAKHALAALKRNNQRTTEDKTNTSLSQYVYEQMIEISGPTPEQRIAMLSSSDLWHVWEKQKSFNVLRPKDAAAISSMASQKTRGKALSQKQIEYLKNLLELLAQNQVITRDSIDGDVEICNRILDALGL
jgi:hypothetical protein